ncbi:hypothetical protein ACFXG8_38665 [Kitasatospora indigofera]|uniref:hypothetical protein n=1 Tax=Kitasatospora indigofera TaxID=67307 RepID=UPI0036817A47
METASGEDVGHLGGDDVGAEDRQVPGEAVEAHHGVAGGDRHRSAGTSNWPLGDRHPGGDHRR